MKRFGTRDGSSSSLPYAASILVVAALGHILVLRTWWFHDDWVFLADAAGLADRSSSAVRFVSYDVYWRLLYPLFGLTGWAYGLTRLAIHATTAWLVGRLARQARATRAQAVIASLLYAAAPSAFESLYWGTGIVELLGVVFTAAAVERWFSGHRFGRIWGLAFAALALGSKEVGLFLPLLFGWDLARRREGGTATWFGVILLSAFAAWMATLLAVDAGDAGGYSVDAGRIPRNLCVYGFWLAAPAPWQFVATLGSRWALAAGGLVWSAWLVSAFLGWRRNDRRLMFLLVTAVVVLAPVLAVGDHALPRYVLGACIPGALALAMVAVPARLGLKPWGTITLGCLLVAVTAWGVHHRLERRWPAGRPVHRLVVKEEISRKVRDGLVQLRGELGAGDRLVFLIDPDTTDDDLHYLRDAVAGSLGPRLMLGDDIAVDWRKALGEAEIGSYVILVKGVGLEALGHYRPRPR